MAVAVRHRLRDLRARDLALHTARFSKPAGYANRPQAYSIQNNHRHRQQVRCSPLLALHAAGRHRLALDDRQPAELATHKARVSARQARSMRPKSNEDDLSAEVIPCDRADSHGQHGSAIMLMAWRSAPPRSCWKCKLEDQLDVESKLTQSTRLLGDTWRRQDTTIRGVGNSQNNEAKAAISGDEARTKSGRASQR